MGWCRRDGVRQITPQLGRDIRITFPMPHRHVGTHVPQLEAPRSGNNEQCVRHTAPTVAVQFHHVRTKQRFHVRGIVNDLLIHVGQRAEGVPDTPAGEPPRAWRRAPV